MAESGDVGTDVADRLDPDAVLGLLGTARAVRELRPDPVPPDVVERLIWAATRASSPNNSQHWHFVVVADPVQRRALGDALQPFLRWIDRLPEPVDASDARTRAAAESLLRRFAEAPVIVAVCCEDAYPPRAPEPRYLWSTVGAAMQNLIVAARAHGLGATVTMFHVANEAGVEAVLGVPEGVRVGCLIPIGWPAAPFGPVRRRPLSEVLHHDRW